MQVFENDQTDMVKNIELTNHRDNFQKKIINDTKKIHNSNKIFIYSLTKPNYILQVSQTTKS